MKLRHTYGCWVLIIFTLLTVLMITACSGTAPTATATPSTFFDLLNLQPESALSTTNAGQNYILLHDFAKIREAYGISLPASNNENDINNYDLSIFKADSSLTINYTGGPPYLSLDWASGFNAQYLEVPAIRNNTVGYGPPDVGASIVSSIGLGLIGNFNPVATQSVFNQQSGWSQWTKDNFATQTYQNISINTWGDIVGSDKDIHLLDRLQPPLFDQLGRICPIAVTQQNIFYSKSVTNIKSMIDSKIGKSNSLASQSKYASAARGLTELGAYSAIICNDSYDVTPTFTDLAQLKSSDNGQDPLLKPYSAMGSGVGKDEKGIYIAIVLVYNDDKSAADNAKILQTRVDNGLYNNGTTQVSGKQFFKDTQIKTEGNVVLAKLYDTANINANRIAMSFSYSFLLHE